MTTKYTDEELLVMPMSALQDLYESDALDADQFERLTGTPFDPYTRRALTMIGRISGDSDAHIRAAERKASEMLNACLGHMDVTALTLRESLPYIELTDAIMLGLLTQTIFDFAQIETGSPIDPREAGNGLANALRKASGNGWPEGMPEEIKSALDDLIKRVRGEASND